MAVEELGDPVVWSSKGDEIVDGRRVAPLHVGAEEETALRETERVDGRRGRKDRIRRELRAHLIQLLRGVAQEGRLTIHRCRVAQPYEMDVGPRCC